MKHRPNDVRIDPEELLASMASERAMQMIHAVYFVRERTSPDPEDTSDILILTAMLLDFLATQKNIKGRFTTESFAQRFVIPLAKAINEWQVEYQKRKGQA